MPEEPLVHLSEQEQHELTCFPKFIFPDNDAGWIDTVKHVLSCFVPNLSPITVPETTAGYVSQFSRQGYWGSVRLAGVAASESLVDFLEHSNPERARNWSGTIAGIPVVITVDITPRQTLLTPWELAHRQVRFGIPSASLDDVVDLDARRIPQCVMDAFQNRNFRLAKTGAVSVVLPGMEWQIETEATSFIARRSSDSLHVYSVETEVIDDRTVYQHLRRAASMWLRDHQVEEHGLHLFWHRQMDAANGKENDYTQSLGKMALTCLERDSAGSLYRWARCYLLIVIDPWSGAIGQVTLTISMPCSGDDAESSLRLFMRITPQCDRIAESLQYLGAPRATWKERALAVAISTGVGVALMFVLMPHWPTWLQIAAGSVCGLLMTPRLLRRSQPTVTSVKHAPCQERRFHSRNYGFTLTVPLGWRIYRGLLAYVINRLEDAEVRCVPIGKGFPQLAVNAAHLTPAERRHSDSELTQAWHVRSLQTIDQRTPLQAASVESTSEILVDGIQAFELVYTRPSAAGRTGFYKVGLFHDGKQFFIQGSCEDLDRDVSAMRSIVQSIRFEKPVVQSLPCEP